MKRKVSQPVPSFPASPGLLLQLQSRRANAGQLVPACAVGIGLSAPLCGPQHFHLQRAEPWA